MAEENRGSGDTQKRRILAMIPLVYGEKGEFWNRDVGLIVRALRGLGHDAWLVAIKNPAETPVPERPVIRATMDELRDPAWWQKQNADAIILNAWSATRWEAIRRAVVAAGKPVIEKLDTDGTKSPKVWFNRYLQRNLLDYQYSDSWLKTLKLWARQIAQVLIIYFFPGLLDRKMIKGMEAIPVFAAETPLAVARVKRFLRMYNATPMPQVVTIPHPVNAADMRLLSSDQKENIVVAVGRWNEAVKGGRLLFQIAERFTAIRPDWKVVVMGGLPKFSAAEQEKIDAMGDRLVLAGRLEHAQLSEWNRKAKIYLLTSHSETFNIAAVEAMCCGCSVVGPSQIASASYFAGFQSGTPSYVRSPDHMTDALVAEVDEWERGQRNPIQIAASARENFAAEMVAKRYLEVFAGIEAAQARQKA